MGSRADDKVLFFKALADQTRFRLIELLARKPGLRVGELVDILGVRQPSASRHLAYLRRLGLITVQPAGRKKLYSVAPPTCALHEAVLTTLASTPSDRRKPTRRRLAAKR